MTPLQFTSRLQKGQIPAVCLFLGSESFERRRCREALIRAHLGTDNAGLVTALDAAEFGLQEIVDDARTLTLFARERLILVRSAEAALPRGARVSEDETDDEAGASPSGALAAYTRDPTPGVVLLFEATRWDLDGEDKRKADRVRKFYGAIPDVVEFKQLQPEEAVRELRAIASERKISVEPRAAAMLVEALASDMGRIAIEFEKLATFAGQGTTVTADHVTLLIPDARESTTYALVRALGRRDRAGALASLDALCKNNEYLPLALSFLSTQFRQALAAREANLRNAAQLQSYFSKHGVQIWGHRAEQVLDTAQRFTTDQLRNSVRLIFEADRDLRDARPDDRVVMEEFVVQLTA